MTEMVLNGEKVFYDGSSEQNLLSYLREEKRLTAAKDGCSGEGICGACIVEVNGKPTLACSVTMDNLDQATVYTLEGIPQTIRKIIATAFVNKGAFQCGFCTPGFIMRTHLLLKENPRPTREEVQQALNGHLCRCMGHNKKVLAIQDAGPQLCGDKPEETLIATGTIGSASPRYNGMAVALGESPFIDDLYREEMLHGALRFSDHPRARILNMDISEASNIPGVVAIYTAKDIPGKRHTGLQISDCPLMIDIGEVTHCTRDVFAGVVATTPQIARQAAQKINVEYDILEAVTETDSALMDEAIQVHEGKSNLLKEMSVSRGETEKAIKESDFVISGKFTTQRIEHAFLETESSLAWLENGGLTLYSSGQGIYEDQRQVAEILGITREKVTVIHVPGGGAFGGREDLSVQGYAALFAWLTQKPVKVTLNREESFRMHPKRHPLTIDISLGCDENGVLTALKMKALADTGAYASSGIMIMNRIAAHATGGYYVPNIEVQAMAVYTNNIPSGSMRGSGVAQINFALESCIDELCKLGDFDRWQIRYDNALTEGLATSAGDPVKKPGIMACLETLKSAFYEHKFTGLACAIKNSGTGNGEKDFCDVLIEIVSQDEVILRHGWSEMGQGINTIARQLFYKQTGIDPKLLRIETDTRSGLVTGMTNNSRGTVLLGNAIMDACKCLKADLKVIPLKNLAGKKYPGRWECNWTRNPADRKRNAKIHYAYGYAAQLVVLNETGQIEKVMAATDAGRIFNPLLYESHIEGAIQMGLGYALSEEFKMEKGYIKSKNIVDCNILTADQLPAISILPVEIPDPVGPYGAKGISEIGIIPTAAAVANAFSFFDNIRQYNLPLTPPSHEKE